MIKQSFHFTLKASYKFKNTRPQMAHSQLLFTTQTETVMDLHIKNKNHQQHEN